MTITMDFGGQSLLNIPEIKFHFILNAQLQPTAFHSYNDKNPALQMLNGQLFSLQVKSYQFLVEYFNS